MAKISEYIYIGYDGTIDLLLTSDGVAQDLSSVTMITLKLGSVTITNTVSTSWPIKWTGLGMVGKIQIKLGDILTTPYIGDMHIIIYDADNPNGIYWGAVGVKVMSI